MNEHTKSGLMVPARAAVLIMAVVLVLLAVAPMARAQDEAIDESIAELIRQKMERITALEKESGVLGKLVRDESSSLKKKLEDAKSKYSAIVLDRGFERYSPFAARELNEKLGSLLVRVSRLTSPLEKLQLEISVNKDNLEAILEEVNSIDMGSLEPSERNNVSRYLKKVKSMEKTLTYLGGRVEKAISSSESFKEKLKEKRTALETGIPSLWARFLSSQSHSVFTVEYWPTLPGYFDLWLGYIKDQISRFPGTPAREYYNAVFMFLLITGIVAALGLWFKREVVQPLSGQVSASLDGCRIPWMFLSLGAGFSMISVGDGLELDGPSRFLGSVFIVWGAVNTCWNIKSKLENLTGKMPLVPYFVLFCIGLLFLGLGFPNAALALAWGIVSGSLFFVKSDAAGYGLWGRVISGSRKVLGAVLCLVAFSGFGRLSILILIVFFLIMASILVSTTTTCLLRKVLGATPDTGLARMGKGVMLGVSTPLAWFATFSAALFLLTEHLGGFFIVRKMISLEMSLKGFSIKLVSVFLVVALFYVTRTTISIFRDLLESQDNTRTKAKRDYVHSLQSLVGYGSWAVYIILSLYLLGISLTSLTVIAGGLSVGIGFGMQNIISNFVSGLVLLFGRSIREGDVLQFDTIWCTVKKISFRSTIVETFDNAVLIIPNSELITTRILNWTSNNMVVRRDLQVGVAYGSDTQEVLRTLMAVADEHQRVLKLPKPVVIFESFGASSLDFVLRVWIDSIDNSISTLSDLHYMVDTRFREKGIEIAFPQLDVHHRSGAVPVVADEGEK